ncbi:MAG TPA: hypothetical protein VEK56_11275 [Vicinamibacterales bacterium]|nr:hypothetical protein [Vicinamibacterales bacterium]
MRAVAVLVVALVSLSACGPSGPLRVNTIQLGRSLNPDNTIASHAALFKPSDTIYVSVLTTDAGVGTIAVRWMYFGRLVSEAEKKVSYRDDAATEFHIQNSGRFPEGDYTVDVLVDGQSVGTRTFRVSEK